MLSKSSSRWLLSRALRASASDKSSVEEVEQLLKKASSIVVTEVDEVQRCKPFRLLPEKLYLFSSFKTVR